MFAQRALLSCTANIHFLASLTQGHTKQQNSMEHPFLNPCKYQIAGVNLQSFLLQEHRGPRNLQIKCHSQVVASQQLLAKEQPLKATGSCKTRLINLAVDTVICRREILQSLATKVCDNCNRFGGPAIVCATCTALMNCKYTLSCLFDTRLYKAAE